MEEKELTSVRSTGRSVDEAIFKGLQQMEISIDEVSIEIIQQETKGILGIGAKPAIVLLTKRPPESFDMPEYAAKYEEREPSRRDDRRRRDRRDDRRDRREKPDRREKAEAPAAEKNEEPKAEPAKPAEERPERREKPARREKNDRPMKAERREKPAEPKPTEAKPAEPKPAEAAPAEAAEPKVINYTLEEAEGNPAAEFVKGLIEHMGAEGRVLAAHDEDCLRLRIDSEMMGMLIGHRGETLDAMQYLTGLVVNKNRKTDGYTRVTLNTEEYREKREETLKRLAKKVASQVRATGRPRALEPMNPYERRVLHSTLQNNPDVTTHSEGEEPNRRVVVTPRRPKGRSYSKPRNARRNGPVPAVNRPERNEDEGDGTISREEYMKLYEAARAANPMFSGRSTEEK
ncbi:MAG: Jag N-terminal domain-containing protein [Clostridiales bacterium]|nr:Jag N-terminal domain-containing protein [Clostridiales bacterium]